MRSFFKAATTGAAVLALASATGCAGTGGLGSVLGGVLGGGQQQNQVSGYVSGVDTRNRRLGLQQQNGQTVTVLFDQNTQVVYQNQSYPVSSLENGDQVTLRLQQAQNGDYYTDYVQVDQSVRNSRSNGGTIRDQQGNQQSFEGSVRGVYPQRGYFTMNVNNSTITVELPNPASRDDMNRLNSLRSGEFVRIYGIARNDNTVQLTRFQ